MKNNYVQEQKNLKSKCCHAPVKLGGTADFAEYGDSEISTRYWVCENCNQACDATGAFKPAKIVDSYTGSNNI